MYAASLVGGLQLYSNNKGWAYLGRWAHERLHALKHTRIVRTGISTYN